MGLRPFCHSPFWIAMIKEVKMIDFRKFSPAEPHDFEGFLKISDMIKDNCSMVPARPGIYIIFSSNRDKPTFCNSFKAFSADPVPARDIGILEKNWIEDTGIIYIGKARNLKNRLQAYMKWGQGKRGALGHKGGRDIWQLKNAGDMLVAWHVEESEAPEAVEKELLGAFKKEFQKYPFANHRQ